MGETSCELKAFYIYIYILVPFYDSCLITEHSNGGGSVKDESLPYQPTFLVRGEK